MVDIEAILKAFPLFRLEAYWLASINLHHTINDGSDLSIQLLEPLASQRIPLIECQGALETLLNYISKDSKSPLQSDKNQLLTMLKMHIPEHYWITLFDDFDPDSKEAVPVIEFVKAMRQINSIPDDLLDFIQTASDIASQLPVYHFDDRDWSLQNLPELPIPKAMIEFVPGVPWDILDEETCEQRDHPFFEWRKNIQPVAEQLEKNLGEKAYYFRDLDDDLDDDNIHRFLVLHWCCTFKPDSPFVKYLIKVSGAQDVEELKSALVSPKSYRYPYKMCYAFFDTVEPRFIRFEYLPPEIHKTVGVVFETEAAKQIAEQVLIKQIGKHCVIVAPTELIPDSWIKRVTGHCRSITLLHSSHDPISLLATLDEINIIADDVTPATGFDLMLSERCEYLLWSAIHYQVEYSYWMLDGRSLSNPETILKKRGVVQRFDNQLLVRQQFTQQLSELRLHCDYGSSGLWDQHGYMLTYDKLNLPFSLIQRIAAWQRDFDQNALNAGDDWWLKHDREEAAIAQELQHVLGSNMPVKVYQHDQWWSVTS